MTTGRAVVLLMLPVCLCSAQLRWLRHDSAKPKKESDDTILGIVVRKNPASFLIRTVDTRFITFAIADSTLYFHGVKWASATMLKRGAAVRVESAPDRDGNLTATTVVFEDHMPTLQASTRAADLLPNGIASDPLIERARQASDHFFRVLPDFICQQSTTRSYAGADQRWRLVDQITAEVVYGHGKESYRDVKLNGRATGRSMMDLPGSRSTGEFGSTLRALFDRKTAALFHLQSSENLRGFSTAVYQFAVSGESSDWRISAGSQAIFAPYTGRIWIDRASGQIVRLEMKAMSIPASFPFQRVDAEVDYGPVVLASGRYFLPERAQNVSCNNPKSCSRNLIEFRNYHKYTGESSISYDAEPEPEPDPKTDPEQSGLPPK